MKWTVVVAEKPSVARDIARVLGASKKAEGYFEGNGYRVSWAIGHLLGIAEPQEINPAWRAWSLAALPMFPQTWPLREIPSGKRQLKVLGKLLRARDTELVIAATDAGREGELIFRYIYEHLECRKPFQRLWISSLTDAAIKAGFSRLRSAGEMEQLAAAAAGRARADWLVGMNLSRAYSLWSGDKFSVGRVQTPTLAMIVNRDLEIDQFVPQDFLTLQATFGPAAPQRPDPYLGTWIRTEDPKAEHPDRLPPDGVEAGEVAARVRAGTPRIREVSLDEKRMLPPLLYDLTELQRRANRQFGFSAERTLAAAQALYEKHKAITYPRTDSRYLTRDVASDLGPVVEGVRGPYEGLIDERTGQVPIPDRFVNDGKVSDHHAIIPTGKKELRAPPGSDEARIYDLICRRLLAAWQGPKRWAETRVVTRVEVPNHPGDLFRSLGTTLLDPGWTRVDDLPKSGRKAREEQAGDGNESVALPPGLEPGELRVLLELEQKKGRTSPPRRFSEATLLTAMETAGRTLDDKALSEAMRERGLGTPATRAATIETLLSRGYIVREARNLVSTELGRRLIASVAEAVKSPAMTGEWEHRLKLIERGGESLASFMDGIRDLIIGILGKTRDEPLPGPASGRAPGPTRGLFGESEQAEASRRGGALVEKPPKSSRGQPRAGARDLFSPAESSPPPPLDSSLEEPVRSRTNDSEQEVRAQVQEGRELAAVLRETFKLPGFRPHQEEICQALVEGHDGLVVMPTGAGKSLCYQLPGLVRPGTTLVISPLIALMEDQVEKLCAQGLTAARIHSGRTRAESHQVCVDYLARKLDFLFIAPERLGVKGFPEFLARGLLSLVAVDEAHCISQWGHDFRPDYRLINERLKLPPGVPMVALTATATRQVQEDILEQLARPGARRFIHGFRRDNLAIEVIEMRPGAREDAVMEILAQPGSRPAIVYCPTRKETDRLLTALRPRFKAAAYHAGMSAEQRERSQQAFLQGEIDLVLATVAFGMGIDKPDVRTVIHTALPASVEGYYQEIGRAGRDGLPSRAILLHSYGDRRTHLYFHERDYPLSATLSRLMDLVGDRPLTTEELLEQSGMDEELFTAALDKLWVHKGVLISPEQLITRGSGDWKATYEDQRNHKLFQLELMARFASGSGCRMVELIRHFGDETDSGRGCGICDFCAPDQTRLARFREPNTREELLLVKILAALAEKRDLAAGTLLSRYLDDCDREQLDLLLDCLVRAGQVKLALDSFEKDGRTIQYRRVVLEPEGVRAALTGRLPEGLLLQVPQPPAPKTRRVTVKKRVKKAGTPGKTRASRSKSPPEPRVQLEVDGASLHRYEALKQWRLLKARKVGVPAFRIATDQLLRELAESNPRSFADLLQVAGMGPVKLKKFGDDLLKVLSGLG